MDTKKIIRDEISLWSNENNIPVHIMADNNIRTEFLINGLSYKLYVKIPRNYPENRTGFVIKPSIYVKKINIIVDLINNEIATKRISINKCLSYIQRNFVEYVLLNIKDNNEKTMQYKKKDNNLISNILSEKMEITNNISKESLINMAKKATNFENNSASENPDNTTYLVSHNELQKDSSKPDNTAIEIIEPKNITDCSESKFNDISENPINEEPDNTYQSADYKDLQNDTFGASNINSGVIEFESVFEKSESLFKNNSEIPVNEDSNKIYQSVNYENLQNDTLKSNIDSEVIEIDCIAQKSEHNFNDKHSVNEILNRTDHLIERKDAQESDSKPNINSENFESDKSQSQNTDSINETDMSIIKNNDNYEFDIECYTNTTKYTISMKTLSYEDTDSIYDDSCPSNKLENNQLEIEDTIDKSDIEIVEDSNATQIDDKSDIFPISECKFTFSYLDNNIKLFESFSFRNFNYNQRLCLINNIISLYDYSIDNNFSIELLNNEGNLKLIFEKSFFNVNSKIYMLDQPIEIELSAVCKSLALMLPFIKIINIDNKKYNLNGFYDAFYDYLSKKWSVAKNFISLIIYFKERIEEYNFDPILEPKSNFYFPSLTLLNNIADFYFINLVSEKELAPIHNIIACDYIKSIVLFLLINDQHKYIDDSEFLIFIKNNNIINYIISEFQAYDGLPTTENKLFMYSAIDLFNIMITRYPEALKSVDVITKYYNMYTFYLATDKNIETDTYNLVSYYVSMCEKLHNLLHSDKDIVESTNTDSQVLDEYVKILGDYVLVQNTNDLIKPVTNTTTNINAICKDLAMFKNAKVVNFNSSIFINYNTDLRFIDLLITGSADTSYDSGCFLFKIDCSDNYPCNYPKVTYCGLDILNSSIVGNKLCISLLTGYDLKKQGWIPNKSNLLQLALSIQSMLLNYDFDNNIQARIDFNSFKSNIFNTSAVLVNMKNIINVIGNPYKNFEYIIKQHFRIKSYYIKKIYTDWVANLQSSGKCSIEIIREAQELYIKLCSALDSIN